jgi:methylmalonyl-CoA mutase cobalamin-binding domain/chain
VPRTFRVVVARTATPDAARGGSAGSDLVARSLRDAGFEVIYGPSSAAPDQLAEAVLQEDADAVALDVTEVANLTAALGERGIEDVLVVAIEGDGHGVAASIARGLGLDGDS